MAYSAKAKELRRCRHVMDKGRRCKAWAVWGDERTLCRSHGGTNPAAVVPSEKTRPVKCTCAAYARPHRPGGGLCRWADPRRSESASRRRAPTPATACRCQSA